MQQTDNPAGLERRVAVHAALADPARLRITDTLGAGDASPSELAAMLAMPSNLLAHHLRVLEEAGLVTRRRSDGYCRRTYLRLAPACAGRRRTVRAERGGEAGAVRVHRQFGPLAPGGGAVEPGQPARLSPRPVRTRRRPSKPGRGRRRAGGVSCRCPGSGPGTSATSWTRATWSSPCATSRTRPSALLAAVHWSVPDPVPGQRPRQLRRGAGRA